MSLTILPVVALVSIMTASVRAAFGVRWTAALALFALCLAPQAVADGGDACAMCNGVRAQDEIWVINVRGVCGCCSAENIRQGTLVEVYESCDDEGHRRWAPSDLDSFLAADPTVRTIFFVNGNRVSPADAKCEGLAVYRRLIQFGCDASPIRFVIYSWPSSQVPGSLLHDVRVKAARTGPAGCQMAWLIDQMPEETPISLLGFSFGARIITGALHILAGGSLGGCLELPERVHPERPPMNVVMISSALHAHWLAKGQYHGLAMTLVDQMLLLNNCKDPAMVYYHLLTPGFGGPQALGLCGPTCLDADYASKIVERDMSRIVGAQHNLLANFCAMGPVAHMWDVLVGADASAPARHIDAESLPEHAPSPAQQ
jgi:hypothetical protein